VARRTRFFWLALVLISIASITWWAPCQSKDKTTPQVSFSDRLRVYIDDYTRNIEVAKNEHASVNYTDRMARAWCYYQLGEYEKAVDDYTVVLQYKTTPISKPTFTTAWLGRAAAYAALGRNEEAVDDYNKALASLQHDLSLSWSTFFVLTAVVMTILGIALCYLSFVFFGPNGLWSRRMKESYIPQEFRPAHRQLIREFGAPLQSGGLPLGVRIDKNPFHAGLPSQLSIPARVRSDNPHVLILGREGKGKTDLLVNMIGHDIESAEQSVVVVDSNGELIDSLLSWTNAHPKAAEFTNRIVLVDPLKPGSTPPYNPLEFPDDNDLTGVTYSVVNGFRAVYNEPPGGSGWNMQTTCILRDAVTLLMANGKSLADLPTLLSENDFRDILLEKIETRRNERTEYAALLDAWARYRRMARTDQWIRWIEPILNRLNPMLGDPRMRPLLTGEKSELNLKKVIRERQILLVRLPLPQLFCEGQLLGGLLVAGLKQAAMSYSRSGPVARCSLYTCDFEKFMHKETYDTITSNTDKIKIGLVAASNTLQEIPEEYRTQVLLKSGTLCVFAVTKQDAELLGPQMFRLDGQRIAQTNIRNLFDKTSLVPIAEEERLNTDRLMGQPEGTYYCYRVGSMAGVFRLRVSSLVPTGSSIVAA
jgi:tetratricopeptide (TPR) repeat protein